MKFKTYIIYLAIALASATAITSCSGSKKYSKKAAELAAQGMNTEASDFYLESLYRNPANVDAKIGLKQTGQKRIDKKLEEFYKAYSIKADKQAVYTFLEAEAYQEKCAAFVELTVPSYYSDYYKESLQRYLIEIYEQANDLLDQEKFKEAQVYFDEIVQLDPTYEDANQLKKLSEIEPIYRQGVTYFEMGQWQECYYAMDQILAKEDYKDAIDYKNMAFEKAVITVAVLPFENKAKGGDPVMQQIQANILKSLMNTSNPFIKVIDRTHTDKILQEQELSMTNAMNSESAIETGELLGAKVIISGSLISYSGKGGKLNKYRRQGFQLTKTRHKNPKTGQVYYTEQWTRVFYTEYEGSSSVSSSFQYQAISTETGEILISNVSDATASDHVNYCTYNGSYKNLYAGSYGKTRGADKIHRSSFQVNALRNKFKTSNRTLASVPELQQVVASKITKQIANQFAQNQNKKRP